MPAVTEKRRQLYAKLHITAKDAGLDDSRYRDFLHSRTGRTTARDLGDDEIGVLLDELTAKARSAARPPGRKRRPVRPARSAQAVIGKIRALWLSNHHLGVVERSDDDALAAFVRRQTGVDDPNWITVDDADKVIEALKAMAARDGGVEWKAYKGKLETAIGQRRAVIDAQWKLLIALGWVKHPRHVSVEDYGERVTGVGGFDRYDARDFDQLIRALGRAVRGAKKNGTPP